jgi:hypothetical protein
MPESQAEAEVVVVVAVVEEEKKAWRRGRQ